MPCSEANSNISLVTQLHCRAGAGVKYCISRQATNAAFGNVNCCEKYVNELVYELVNELVIIDRSLVVFSRSLAVFIATARLALCAVAREDLHNKQQKES